MAKTTESNDNVRNVRTSIVLTPYLYGEIKRMAELTGNDLQGLTRTLILLGLRVYESNIPDSARAKPSLNMPDVGV